MFGPHPARVAARMGRLLAPEERVVRAVRANIPARSATAGEWVVLTDRRLVLLTATDLGDTAFPIAGLIRPEPDPASVRAHAFGTILRVDTTPGTHRVVDDVTWSTYSTLRVAMRDGTVERIGLRQSDADALFDDLRRHCALRGGAPAAAAGDDGGEDEPRAGGDAWVPVMVVASTILTLPVYALILAVRG